VTAETAVALPGIVILVTGLLALPLAVGAQARCNDAAREAARAVARGDDPAAAARAVDPASSVTVTRSDGLVTVVVTAPAELPLVGSVGLDARAVTADELSAGAP
jgi:Flp pilus assembly protein TadG